MHATQQVIAAVQARLVGNTDAGSRVYTDRLWPMAEADLPAWKVYPLSESVEQQTVHYPSLGRHRLTLALVACAAAVAGIDAVMAALRLQAELALFATLEHATLNPLGVQMALRSAIVQLGEPGGDKQIAELALSLEIEFNTLANAPETLA